MPWSCETTTVCCDGNDFAEALKMAALHWSWCWHFSHCKRYSVFSCSSFFNVVFIFLGPRILCLVYILFATNESEPQMRFFLPAAWRWRFGLDWSKREKEKEIRLPRKKWKFKQMMFVTGKEVSRLSCFRFNVQERRNMTKQNIKQLSMTC